MTMDEFLYEHDLPLVIDLIDRHLKFHYGAKEDDDQIQVEEVEVMRAGDFLL